MKPLRLVNCGKSWDSPPIQVKVGVDECMKRMEVDTVQLSHSCQNPITKSCGLIGNYSRLKSASKPTQRSRHQYLVVAK